MLCVDLNADGPDMDEVEDHVRNDPSIAFMWCVPKHSNPTGCSYSDEVVARIAALPRLRADSNENPFFVLWDNAYAVHDFGDEPEPLASIYEHATNVGTLDRVITFASTSKITHAGAGIAFLASSERVLTEFEGTHVGDDHWFDKVNQLRHARFFQIVQASMLTCGNMLTSCVLV